MIANRHACAAILLAAAFCLPGCGPTDQPAATIDSNVQVTSYRDMSAKQYLRAVLSRYRAAASYRDSGQVRLAYEADGKIENRHAPLSLWYDHDSLYVEAYDARIWSDPSAVTAWMNDPSTNHFDSQVLRAAPIAGRPTLESLLADPILHDRIAAGLAGPPPQMEWLFAAQPMKHLFHDQNRFQFGESQSVDRRSCTTVRVDAGGETYVFSIDERDGVIRRIELPVINVATAPTESPTKLRLVLDLAGATFDAPSQSPPIEALPAKPQFVRRFIPLPPPKPLAALGSRPGRFQLTDRAGRITLSERGSDREVTLLVQFDGAPQSHAAVDLIARWNEIMPELLKQRVRTIVFVTDDARDRIPDAVRLPMIVDRGDHVAASLGLSAGTLSVQDSTGRLVWSQTGVTESSLLTLGAILGDILQGVDVPARLRNQWKADDAAYRSVIRQEQRHRPGNIIRQEHNPPGNGQR